MGLRFPLRKPEARARKRGERLTEGHSEFMPESTNAMAREQGRSRSIGKGKGHHQKLIYTSGGGGILSQNAMVSRYYSRGKGILKRTSRQGGKTNPQRPANRSTDGFTEKTCIKRLLSSESQPRLIIEKKKRRTTKRRDLRVPPRTKRLSLKPRD